MNFVTNQRCSLTPPGSDVCNELAKTGITQTMKKTICLLTALLTLPFLTPASAGDKAYPKKDPVLTYSVPEGWETEVDEKDGSIAVNAKSGLISVNFAEVPVEASMEIFEKLLPDMLKELEGATVVDKPKEHTEDGLTGFTATYAAKIEGKPAMCIFILFKGGKDRAVLGNIVVSDPEKLPKEDSEALGKFMQSMKGAAK